MTAEELQTIIRAGLACEHLALEGDGRHWFATIVSSAFEGRRPIQRHQQVYATLGGRMQTDEVHALSMKTYTPAEWAALPKD
ncbi:BolA family protein [Sphingomonas sp. NCPPB 2930]